MDIRKLALLTLLTGVLSVPLLSSATTIIRDVTQGPKGLMVPDGTSVQDEYIFLLDNDSARDLLGGDLDNVGKKQVADIKAQGLSPTLIALKNGSVIARRFFEAKVRPARRTKGDDIYSKYDENTYQYFIAGLDLQHQVFVPVGLSTVSESAIFTGETLALSGSARLAKLKA